MATEMAEENPELKAPEEKVIQLLHTVSEH
jgi:hypothetical protein